MPTATSNAASSATTLHENSCLGHAGQIVPAIDAGFASPSVCWAPSMWVGAVISGVVHGGLLLSMAAFLLPAVMHDGRGDEELITYFDEPTTEQPWLLPSQITTATAGETAQDLFAPEPAQAVVELPAPKLALHLGQTPSNSGGRPQASQVDPVAVPSNQTGPAAQFFGSVAFGTRFVFVLDTSGSMNEGSRFRRAALELLDAVDRLGPEQWFHVVLFNGEARPMFDAPLAAATLVQANDENKARLERWFMRVGPRGWSDPRQAMELALRLEPSAIFLLSDGEFKVSPNNKRIGGAALRRINYLNGRSKTVPIHAIAFEDPINRRVLKALADQSEGSYRYVPPPDAPMRYRARRGK